MIKNFSNPKYLAKHVLRKLQHSKKPIEVPSIGILEKLFSCMFYASMKTEESDFIKVTITLINPDDPDPSPPFRIVADRWNYIKFENQLNFDIRTLVKLSKAADPWSSSLAVYYNKTGSLYIWGMIDQSIHYQSFLNYEADSGPEQPGLFQVSILNIGVLNVIYDYELLASLNQDILITRYLNVFSLGPISQVLKKNHEHFKEDINQFINEFHPDIDSSEWESFAYSVWAQTLYRLLLRIQNYHHGGAILITDLFNDIDIKYKIHYDRLAKAMLSFVKETINHWVAGNQINEHLDDGKRTIPKNWYLNESISSYKKKEISDELTGAIRFLASQSCVDGLVLFNNEMTAKGFGAILKTKQLPAKIYHSSSAEAATTALKETDPKHFGTRHRSVIAFCWKYVGSLGFVVSQDGDIRVFSNIDGKLVMWENIKTQRFFKSPKLKKPIIKQMKSPS